MFGKFVSFFLEKQTGREKENMVEVMRRRIGLTRNDIVIHLF